MMLYDCYMGDGVDGGWARGARDDGGTDRDRLSTTLLLGYPHNLDARPRSSAVSQNVGASSIGELEQFGRQVAFCWG
jgi:hypothetical protein